MEEAGNWALTAAALGGALLSAAAAWRELAHSWAYRRQASELAAWLGLTAPALHVANAAVFVSGFLQANGLEARMPALLAAIVEASLASYATVAKSFGAKEVLVNYLPGADFVVLGALSAAAASMALAGGLSILSSLPASIQAARRTRDVLNRLEAAHAESEGLASRTKSTSKANIRYL